MKNVLAVFGAFVALLWLFGSLNVGNFRLYYGPDEFTCTKSTKEQP